ncbi:bifunctional metallophosphatase/5'-nucleotidase [Haloferula chungangensis]|uniref:Bifunctional metallophosphatase/5'-nucleotidase n=1 Tax=Haloferula chungangensis TaxID=1048331 RepID=A0ABW2L4E7_9BACT
MIREIRRRDFIVSGAGWLGSMLAARAVEEKRAKTISIFHTTDLHGHIEPTLSYDGLGDVGGIARCATQIRRWRKQFPDSILVDVGDVYQGTPVGLQSDGRIMIDLFNRLDYDAWVIGNHDFDWGREVLEGNLQHSKAKVLTGNLRIGHKAVGQIDGAWKNVLPWTIRETAGFKIGLVGLTTPGMPFWLAPETLGGVEVFDPAESLKQSVAELKSENVDAIVVMGHMGWRWEEDYANPVPSLLRNIEGVDVYLAGHSHQDRATWYEGNTICSQASYFGIHCGRVDLTFDLESRTLIERKAFTVRMDGRFELDPAVMDTARPQLKEAAETLTRKVCTVKTEIPLRGEDSLRTIFCQAFASALKRDGTEVDGVFHGTFGSGPLEAGEVTVGDCWKHLPYENLLITVELDARELRLILEEEDLNKSSDRVLWPFDLERNSSGEIQEIRLKGAPLKSDKRYLIAMNSYDAQSGGKSMMTLRRITQLKSSNRQMTRIATREALIDWFLEQEII